MTHLAQRCEPSDDVLTRPEARAVSRNWQDDGSRQSESTTWLLPEKGYRNIEQDTSYRQLAGSGLFNSLVYTFFCDFLFRKEIITAQHCPTTQLHPFESLLPGQIRKF
jgi:hypothetical protein